MKGAGSIVTRWLFPGPTAAVGVLVSCWYIDLFKVG